MIEDREQESPDFVEIPLVGGPRDGETYDGIKGLLSERVEFNISETPGPDIYVLQVLDDETSVYFYQEPVS